MALDRQEVAVLGEFSSNRDNEVIRLRLINIVEVESGNIIDRVLDIRGVWVNKTKGTEGYTSRGFSTSLENIKDILQVVQNVDQAIDKLTQMKVGS